MHNELQINALIEMMAASIKENLENRISETEREIGQLHQEFHAHMGVVKGWFGQKTCPTCLGKGVVDERHPCFDGKPKENPNAA